MTGLWIVFAVVALVIVFVIAAYNRLVSLREQVRSNWAQIDVALKRRHDLIPNLVETVKGYAAHEKDTLDDVITARNRAVAASAAGDAGQASVAESLLGGAMRRLFALAEAYPDLKANQNFLHLQHELTGTETQIAAARQDYNALVAEYNTATLSFPNNLIAGPFGFNTQPFFEIQDISQREAPAVRF